MSTAIEPNPVMIGGIPKPPLAFLPDPAKVFEARARRFAFLARSGNLGPYLGFLADLSRLQARLAAELPPVAPPDAARIEQARAARMPPIDRARLTDDPALGETLERLCAEAGALEMPAQARLALDAVKAAETRDRRWLLGNILSDQVPGDAAAPHLFAAAAVQVHLARLAASLPAGRLVPIRTGICPACGGRPATSSVSGEANIERTRFAACACCATRWNEVRVKCLCCASTKGISYRSAGTDEATVKAEVCTECDHWVKILYQNINVSLDPIADDVASLGLDMLMKDTGLTRGGFNPFIAGY